MSKLGGIIMVGKMSIKIFKLLKAKEDNYQKNKYITSLDEGFNGSQCSFNELKENFEFVAYSSFIATLICLLDDKYIMTNQVDDPFSFIVEQTSKDDYKFILTDKGRAYLENLTYMRMSKYIPLIISIISIGIAITSFILTLLKYNK